MFKIPALLTILILLGSAFFCYYLDQSCRISNLAREKSQKIKFFNSSNQELDIGFFDSYGQKIRIPTFKNGNRSSELVAEKAIWKRGEAIHLTSPVLYEYEPDGITPKTRISGDFGKVEISENIEELDAVEIWGNARIIRKGNKDKTKK